MPEAKSKYLHKEAFCLMRYASNDGTVNEMLWNSRDGVTPFIIRSADGKHELAHADWNSDRCTERFLPPVGMRVFVDLTPERARAIATQDVERYWEHEQYPLKERYPDKETAIKAFVSENRTGTPDVIVADVHLRERLLLSYSATCEPIEFGSRQQIEMPEHAPAPVILHKLPTYEEAMAPIREWICVECHTVLHRVRASVLCLLCPKCGGYAAPHLLWINNQLQHEVTSLKAALKLAQDLLESLQKELAASRPNNAPEEAPPENRVAFTNDILKNLPPIGTETVCPHCRETHPVEFGEEILPNGVRKPSKLLGFVTCPTSKRLYLVAVNGMRIPHD